ncbi:hypothetical protein SDC9_02077 [bioreactor metagenome]|uniref:DUF5977 domain-containing protein n=1 Tax=bioreactor metagenome TaxID=1076179 RepID=A0A644SSF9_9ZZZZ
MIKKYTSFILLIINSFLFGQNNVDFTKYYFNSFPNSPSTSTFLRYGDIQNNEFTGSNTPKIELYTVKDGAIVLPLNLDYLAGNGVKVTDEATSVGLGWNIGLPTITQSVMGYDDFDVLDYHPNLKIDYHAQPATWPVLNYNNKYIESQEKQEPSDYINSPKVGEYTYHYAVNNVLPVNGYFTNINGTNNNQYDVSPDIFILNLFGDKVEFIIENFKDIETSNVIPYFVPLNKHGYQISYDKNSLFTITAPDGVKYLFEKAETVTIFGPINRNYVLTKIIDINNNTIIINYKEYKDILNFVPFSRNLNYTLDRIETAGKTECSGIPIFYGGAYLMATMYNSMYKAPNSEGSDNNNFNSFPYLAGQKGDFVVPSIEGSYFTKQNYLLVSNISGDFGTVIFNYSDRDDFPTQKVSFISIKTTDPNETIKSIHFNYDYFNSPSNNFPNPDSSSFEENRLKKRLKLNSIIINNEEKYSFEYYEKYLLPAKDSYAVDYWGYSNGAIENKTYFLNPLDYKNGSYKDMIPLDANYNVNKKKSDISYCTSGILNKIIYPTKGFSIFEYELNTSSNLFKGGAEESEGKGLRLWRQTNYDNTNNLLSKTEFKYNGGYSTNPLDLVKFKNVSFLFSGSTGEANGDVKATIYTINSTNNYSASPLSSGDYVGYSKVEKIEKDDNSNTKGRTISLYNINPDTQYTYYDDQQPAGLPSTKSEGIENGILLKKILLDNKNDTINIVKNNYLVNYSKVYYGTILSHGGGNLYICKCFTNGGFCPGMGWADPSISIPLSIVGHFPIFHKESLLNSSEIYEFEKGKKIVTIKNYEYNFNNNVIKEKINYADGSVLINETNYAEEEQNYKLKSANMLNIPLRKSTTTNVAKSLHSILTRYDGNGFNPTSVYQIERNSSNISLSRQIVSYDFYDNKGNLLEFRKSNGVPTAIIWGYNNNYPIAKIEGARYADVASYVNEIINYSNQDNNPTEFNLSKEESENLLISSLNNFRNKSELLKYRITTYSYNPLIGVTTITNPNGLIEFYKYNNFNKLDKILDVNNNIIKEFKYKFSSINPSSFYFSNLKSQTFTKNNCENGYVASQYEYVVPANKYTSTLSQFDADQKAINEIMIDGQNKANQYGTCTPTVSCGFSRISDVNFWQSDFKSIGEKVEVDLVFSTYHSSKDWSIENYIGTVDVNCAPITNKTFTFIEGHDGIYRQWEVKIYNNGQITLRKTYGVVDANSNIPVIFNGLIYLKN